MSDTDRVVAGAAVLGALATVASLGPEADRLVTLAVLVLLGSGVVAGLFAHRVHVRRIRRDIERRGGTVLRRVRPPRACTPARRRSRPGLGRWARRRRATGWTYRLRDRSRGRRPPTRR